MNENYCTIEPSRNGEGYWLVVHSTYPPSSVLAGEASRCLTQWYETEAEAATNNPEAEVLSHITGDPFSFMDSSPLPDSPPGWFDSANAGEVWHENDY